MAIFCSKCDSRVHIIGPCKVCASVFNGPNCFEHAQRKARYGHRDWIVWADASGSHAAQKSKARLREMLTPAVTSWTLICANDAVPMKGFDYLASNMLSQMEMGL